MSSCEYLWSLHIRVLSEFSNMPKRRCIESDSEEGDENLGKQSFFDDEAIQSGTESLEDEEDAEEEGEEAEEFDKGALDNGVEIASAIVEVVNLSNSPKTCCASCSSSAKNIVTKNNIHELRDVIRALKADVKRLREERDRAEARLAHMQLFLTEQVAASQEHIRSMRRR